MAFLMYPQQFHKHQIFLKIILKSVFIIAIVILCIGLIGLASNSVYARLQDTIGSQGTGNGEFDQPCGIN
jgi:hypothetical protein